VDTLYTVVFREMSGLNSFKNFKNLTIDCEDIAVTQRTAFDVNAT